jgi:hypothetical protein
MKCPNMSDKIRIGGHGVEGLKKTTTGDRNPTQRKPDEVIRNHHDEASGIKLLWRPSLVLLAPRSSPSKPNGENHVAPSKRQINEI